LAVVGPRPPTARALGSFRDQGLDFGPLGIGQQVSEFFLHHNFGIQQRVDSPAPGTIEANPE
jgi:hypothetical protein